MNRTVKNHFRVSKWRFLIPMEGQSIHFSMNIDYNIDYDLNCRARSDPQLKFLMKKILKKNDKTWSKKWRPKLAKLCNTNGHFSFEWSPIPRYTTQKLSKSSRWTSLWIILMKALRAQLCKSFWSLWGKGSPKVKVIPSFWSEPLKSYSTLWISEPICPI